VPQSPPSAASRGARTTKIGLPSPPLCFSACAGRPSNVSRMKISALKSPPSANAIALSASSPRRAFYAMVKEAGLPPLRIHDLRHTSATLLLRAGVGAQVVSKRLGHAKVGFTLDTYAHVLPDQQREAAQALDSILVGKMSATGP
jgi:integrase